MAQQIWKLIVCIAFLSSVVTAQNSSNLDLQFDGGIFNAVLLLSISEPNLAGSCPSTNTSFQIGIAPVPQDVQCFNIQDLFQRPNGVWSSDGISVAIMRQQLYNPTGNYSSVYYVQGQRGDLDSPNDVGDVNLQTYVTTDCQQSNESGDLPYRAWNCGSGVPACGELPDAVRSFSVGPRVEEQGERCVFGREENWGQRVDVKRCFALLLVSLIVALLLP